MNKFVIASLGIACLIGTTAAAADAPKADAPKAEAAKAEAPKAPSAAAVAAGKKIDWEKMDVNAKKKYMKSTVVPQMKKLFVAFDKKKYSAMNCQTCHGKEANERKFKMPSPELPKLPQPTDRAGFMAVQQKKPEMVKFMGTEVKPTMAALLGKTEWTEKTPDGFGCYACHTKEEAATPPGAAPPAAKPGAAPPAAKPGAAPAAPPAAKPGAAPAAPAPSGKGW